MPKQVLPTREDFVSIEEDLLGLGFREYTAGEFRRQFRRLGLRAPRVRPGRETGFIFHANALSVFVWTTWVASEGRAREEDCGWVVICDGDNAVYFAQPTHRTKNFVRNLLSRAWVAHWRVLNRPTCPECGEWMHICRGRSLKSRYWGCSKKSLHHDQKDRRLDWDYGLPPKAKRYVEELRKERARYRTTRRAQGKPVDVAPIRRKSWRQKTKA